MKIIQLIDTLNPGGAERMCVNIANVLHNNGYDVQVCTTRNEGILKKYLNPEIKIHSLKKKNSFDLITFWEFLKILRQEETDIIHAHSTSVFWAVSAKLFRHDIKIIWHDHLGRRTGKNKSNGFYRLISSHIDAIISVNEDIKEWARRNMKVPPERIQYIENFPFLPDMPARKDSDIFTVVCIANILPVKNHEELKMFFLLYQNQKTLDCATLLQHLESLSKHSRPFFSPFSVFMNFRYFISLFFICQFSL